MTDDTDRPFVRAERAAFRDASGCDDSELAFHFNWPFFLWKRLMTSYVGSRETTLALTRSSATIRCGRSFCPGRMRTGKNLLTAS